jgi:hypothetical protein
MDIIEDNPKRFPFKVFCSRIQRHFTAVMRPLPCPQIMYLTNKVQLYGGKVEEILQIRGPYLILSMCQDSDTESCQPKEGRFLYSMKGYFFVYFLWQASVRWSLLYLCRPFCMFERFQNSNP